MRADGPRARRGLLGVAAALALAGHAAAQGQGRRSPPLPQGARALGDLVDPDVNELYPASGRTELPRLRARPADDATPDRRRSLAAALQGLVAAGGRAPVLRILTTGDRAERLLLIGAEPLAYDTEFRGRASLVWLMAQARALPEVAAAGLPAEIPPYEILRLFGFDKVVVSDGRTFSLQVRLDLPG